MAWAGFLHGIVTKNRVSSNGIHHRFPGNRVRLFITPFHPKNHLSASSTPNSRYGEKAANTIGSFPVVSWRIILAMDPFQTRIYRCHQDQR